MFIKLVKIPKKNTHYVQVVESYRDENQIPRHRVLYSYGILEEIQKERPNFLEELKENLKTDFIDFKLDLLKEHTNTMENYGYIIIDKLLRELSLDKIITHYCKDNDAAYQSLLQVLIFRILQTNLKNPLDKLFNFNIKNPSIIKEDLQKIMSYQEEIIKDLYQINKSHIDRSDVMCNVVDFYLEKDTNLTTPEIEHHVTLTLFSDILKQPLYYSIKAHLEMRDNTDYKEVIEIARTTLNLDDITLVAKKEGVNSPLIEVKFAQNNYYIMGSLIKNAEHPYSSIANDKASFKSLPSKGISYKLVTLLRDVFVETKSGKIFKKTLNEKVLLLFFTDEGYELNKALSFLLEENLNIDLENYLFISAKNEVHKGLTFYSISTNDLDLSFYDIINKYLYLQQVKHDFSEHFDEEINSVALNFFLNYLVNMFNTTIVRLSDYKYSLKNIYESLKLAKLIKIRSDLVMITYLDPLLKILLSKWEIELTKQYYRSEKLRRIFKSIS
ncbi:MAG: hypothetical protein LBV55_03380 [Acholeplasmatales bacterium]|nr:hypothetical protein [Acholeplasmatales bacterium]